MTTLTRLAGATALASTLLLVPSAFAQTTTGTPSAASETPSEQEQKRDEQASADGEDRKGEIVITGSRIPRPETDGVLPGVQITSQNIETRGFTNALEALNDIPLVGNGAGFNGNNGGQAASLGSAFVDLLDLGTQRTLTLVNGRRFVSGNAASLFVYGNETGSQVDVNSIPSSLISRVDVLTVGGAAAYGSDAIAGVVNYILKDDYQGFQLRGLTGISERGDAGQQQISLLVGRNFADGRGNITISGEYTHLDGLQADSRDFRLRRATTATNFLNGGVRNPAFASAIIDVQNSNNGAFLRNSDDKQPSTIYGEGFINQSLSFNGTIFNALAAPTFTPYVPLTSGTGASARSTNYIVLQNGLAPVGTALPATTATGGSTTLSAQNIAFFNTAAQIINGVPGAVLISGNGLNGRTTAIGSLPITTFAPTALPTGVTPAQVFAQFGVTPPTGATTSQLSTLAINVLQANRPTAREFFSANPNLNVNYFIGTFVPGVPRIANTDTTLVNVRSNATGGTVQVPVNQVLPFVAVPLEFNTDGSIRPYTFASGVTPSTVLTTSQAPGSNGGFSRSIENVVLRAQQDRYIANLIGKFDVNDEITVFTENLYAHTRSVALRNSPSQNFQTSTQENAPLLLNVNNPFLTASARTALASYGISPTVNSGYFVVTRQNQDIFGNNPFTNTQETYRLVGGVRSKFRLLGHNWTSEISGTYGRSTQRTRTTQIGDIEYQLALDAVDQGLATTGVANGNIVCRAQVFPGQYLGRTPIGTTANLTRQVGSDGLPTEVVVQPSITQSMIDQCRPLNPFGYNNMSAASKAYVRQDVLFRNVAEQTFVQAQLQGGLVELPGGTLSVALAGEYRKEKLDFTSDPLNQLGRGRSAPSANTRGQTETWEAGGEARIPITGPNFLSFLGSLEFDPAIRVSQQSGSAATFRNLAGQVVTPRAKGDPQTIYSLAGSWRPLRDIQFRGNYTKSVRQPSVVELFLGGQPSFTTPTDYCGPSQIDQGLQAVNRRKNCVADVIARGLASDTTTANAFLATFVPLTNGLQGSFSGSPSLQPEKGTSWTAGAAITPRWIPGLSISADYISLELKNIISPVGLATAVQFCYDSPTFPTTAPQTGTNTCGFFTRDANFQIANGFASGFINLQATQVRALNIVAQYPIELPADLGRLTVRGNAYHLIRYRSSAAGDFSDSIETAGAPDRPKWEVQAWGRYEKGGFYSQLTWNWQNKTKILVSGLPATIENYPAWVFPSVSTFDLALGADVNDRFRIQFNVNNLTDKIYYGQIGLYNGVYQDQIGRRFQVAVTTKF